ncbi:MAG TPA: isopeptide-forming domain-containing fimbrial protein [Ruminococcus flavefaciens]|nr:isopeptide-forming domain-containing fimbrial protein [Ruminococcus flavefaciens]HQM00670.1 isopeptide-forming domain-containing fimbrial protein [Ruminococcus flavefaciens]
MKTTKRFIAMAAALTLTACAAMPMSIMTASAADIKITGVSTTQAHTFEVYQIFTGDLSDGTFSNLKWGTGITSYKLDDSTVVNAGTAGTLVPDSVIEDMKGVSGANDSEKARAIIDRITKSTTKACDDVTSVNGEASIEGLANGYYLVLDTTALNGKDDANSAYIIQVAGEGVEVAIKNAITTVDKEVEDETDEVANTGSVFGEAADHAINETFQFKLTATIPPDADLAAYDTYMLKFNDTMSAGVTFESIDSVKISSATLKDNAALTLTSSQYEETATTASNKAGLTWDLTIEDVKSLVNAGSANIFGKEEIKVEVIYNAHLNENAKVDTASRSGGTAENTNNNKVSLEYSNKPDNTGTGTSLGKTQEDYVWVFTYEVDNTKYKISANAGNELEGAGFTLYSDSEKTTAIKLLDNGDGTYTVADQTATSGTITEMTSHTGNGIFNIKGLDAGTYYLRETSVPEGYNKADDITITIGATHTEETNGTAKVVLTGINNEVENKIVDTKNSTLPATGGIGTTLFILGGGCAAGIAGIYLISKKKTREEE